MMTLGQIARVIGGTLQGAAPELTAAGVSTDTRTLRAGQLFFALKGPVYDGHAFVERALGLGAPAVVVAEPPSFPAPVIRVPDPLRALGDLAAAYRLAAAAHVVAITGTNGKTTTKEMTAHLLAGRHAVVRAPLSYNNVIGVPLTLLAADERTDFVVVEAGISAPGEMRRLSQIIRPDTAVITNVSEGHLAGLGTPEGVAREKGELLQGLRGGGAAVLNADNRWTADLARADGRPVVTFGIEMPCAVRARAVRSSGAWVSFVVGDVPFKVRSPNLCNVYNALAAIAVATRAGLSLEACAARLIEFEPPPMRMERVRADGVTFINDAYNANPVSMRAAVASFSRMHAEGRRVAVLGDMRELGPAGPRLHQEVARFAAALNLDLVLTVGPQMERAAQFFDGHLPWAPFADAREAAPFLRAVTRPGDLILLKGSRAMGLESIVEYFRRA
jgi:UDP-N-acetylmuramoyl-tripeptide--D-alanyl-D-alanine ligase